MEKKFVEVRGVRIGEGIPKICVPLTDVNIEELAASAAQIPAYPVDLVEWRLDWFAGGRDPQQVRAAAEKLRQVLGDLPILATIRTEEEGGAIRLSPQEYHDINLALAETGLVDLVDIQVFSCGEQVQDWIRELQDKGVKIIGSWHHFTMTPSQEELEDRLQAMQEAGVDICKIAVMPQSPADVHTLINATRDFRDARADRPLITMSMSGLGVASRIAGERFGSDLSFGTVGKASAPGQIPVTELRTLLEAIHEGKKLVLTGFMGSGKTTMGAALSLALDCPMYDTDQLIEEEEGMTISELFAAKGEPYFRQQETAMIRKLTGREGLAIVSTGGGLPMREENHQPMKELGLVLFLRVRKETVLERLKGDTTRPLLAGPNPAEKVEELLQVRTPIYEKAADLIILTD